MKETLFALTGSFSDALYVATAVCICVILARELIISAFRQIAAANGVVMAAEKLGKYKTACQDAAIFVLILAVNMPVEIDVVVAWIGFALFAVATVLTVWSGISYVVKNRNVLKDN
jgi:CDP-diacylglycerol--glycerol-3-phosphate 3-phosphatidyltransferase